MRRRKLPSASPGRIRAGLALAAWLAGVPFARSQYPSTYQIVKDGTAVQLEDYASLPLSSSTKNTYPPPIDYTYQLGRVNFLRSEPAGAPLAATRLFVADSNRSLYTLDRNTRSFSIYINFEEVFPRFSNFSYAGGIVSFAFDPGYATNGRFYTVHTETNKNASYYPVNTSLPGFNTNGYTPTPIYNPPISNALRESVLIEWTDTNIANAIFEGTARELLRVGFNTIIHPIGDLAFNPLARPGDPDYGNLYIAAGDGGAGETPVLHAFPQRLDLFQGKILRITPDLNLRPADELSGNGRYRIPATGPDPNPFVGLSLTNLKKEIYAYGFRNPHRLAFDPVSGRLIANDIGLHSWEEVNFVIKGGNYGYAEREGPEQLFVGGANNGKTSSQIVPAVPFPNPDSLVVTGLVSAVTPLYPVAAFSHRDGDAICGGIVYRGRLMPALYGKYVWGDITTGRLFYTDFAAMLAADDGDHLTMATNHELQVVFNGVRRRVFDILVQRYDLKGGTSPDALPGGCGGLAPSGNDPDGVPYGCGRADVRLAQDGDGELYLLSKSDGMVRKFTGVLIPPTISSVQRTNGITTLSWPALSNTIYRVQFKTSLTNSLWTDLPGDITATSTNATKTDATGGAERFYRVRAL